MHVSDHAGCYSSAVSCCASTGAMLQLEKRSSMPRALYSLLAAYAMEAAALLFLTVVTFHALDSGRVSCYTDDELQRQVQQNITDVYF